MTRKKRKNVVATPSDAIWCFYCDRTFKDESTLVTHQKAKHFRCATCNKKMNTAQGLQVHCEQVHRIEMKGVPGAKEGRQNMQIEIFGMAGIPPDITPGSTVEQFRKAIKRQVLMGAALVDEKGNFRASGPLNATPPSLIPPPIVPPSFPLQLQTSLEAQVSQPLATTQVGSYGGGGGSGLVSTTTISGNQSQSTPLLFPQGSYGASNQTTNSQQKPTVFPVVSAADNTRTPKTVQAAPFAPIQFIQNTLSGSGNSKLRFIWSNEELSMEEVRAKSEKYASLSNLV